MDTYIDPTIAWFEMWADARTLAKRDWVWRKRLKGGDAERAAATAAHRLWRQNNAEHARAYEREYYARDIEKSREADKAKKRIQKQRDPVKWNAKNAANVARWRRAQGDEGRAKAAAAMTEWRNENAAHHQAYRADYYAQHAEHLKAVVKKWREENHEKWLILHAGQQARRRGAEGTFTSEDFAKLWDKQEGRCVYCRADLSISLNIDHIIAIARGGTNQPDNIQLLCESCNKRKHTKTDAEFRELMLT